MQVLTDTYGRILTQYTQDGDYRTACVYVPGDSRLDWDTASDQELVTLIGKYGYNDALIIVDNDVTISDNGETETLTWDSEAMDFTVDVDMFQNGAQNMYFCTVNDGNRDVTILVDENGKAIQVQTLGGYTDVLFSVANNGTEIDTITSDATYSRPDIINACGGAVNVTALDVEEDVFLLVKGTHVQYCNGVNTTTTPTVNSFPPLYRRLAQDGNYYACTADGRLLLVMVSGYNPYCLKYDTANSQWSIDNSGYDSIEAEFGGYLSVPATSSTYTGFKFNYNFKTYEFTASSHTLTPEPDVYQ